jgi:hypothetical protein
MENLSAWGAGALVALIAMLYAVRTVVAERAAGTGTPTATAVPRPHLAVVLDRWLWVLVAALGVLLSVHVVAGLK